MSTRKLIVRVPGAIAKAVLFGVITGPPLGLFFEWFDQHGFDPLWRHPEAWLLRAAWIGVIYALSFYVLCALVVGYVACRLFQHPAARHATAIVALPTIASHRAPGWVWRSSSTRRSPSTNARRSRNTHRRRLPA